MRLQQHWYSTPLSQPRDGFQRCCRTETDEGINLSRMYLISLKRSWNASGCTMPMAQQQLRHCLCSTQGRGTAWDLNCPTEGNNSGWDRPHCPPPGAGSTADGTAHNLVRAMHPTRPLGFWQADSLQTLCQMRHCTVCPPAAGRQHHLLSTAKAKSRCDPCSHLGRVGLCAGRHGATGCGFGGSAGG